MFAERLLPYSYLIFDMLCFYFYPRSNRNIDMHWMCISFDHDDAELLVLAMDRSNACSLQRVIVSRLLIWRLFVLLFVLVQQWTNILTVNADIQDDNDNNTRSLVKICFAWVELILVIFTFFRVLGVVDTSLLLAALFFLFLSEITSVWTIGSRSSSSSLSKLLSWIGSSAFFEASVSSISSIWTWPEPWPEGTASVSYVTFTCEISAAHSSDLIALLTTL